MTVTISFAALLWHSIFFQQIHVRVSRALGLPQNPDQLGFTYRTRNIMADRKPNRLTALAQRPTTTVYRACTERDIRQLLSYQPCIQAGVRRSDKITARDHVVNGFRLDLSRSPWISVSTDPMWIVYYIAKQRDYEGCFRSFLIARTVSELYEVDHYYARSASELLAHGSLVVTDFLIIDFATDRYVTKALDKVWNSFDGRSYRAWSAALRQKERERERNRINSLIDHAKKSLKLQSWTDLDCSHHFPFHRLTMTFGMQTSSLLIPSLNLVDIPLPADMYARVVPAEASRREKGAVDSLCEDLHLLAL